jgi:hypothetical protein
MLMERMTAYKGGCHCGKVRYEAEIDLTSVLECNCSHCEAKGLLLNFIPKTQFKLLSGEDSLVEYHFNKKLLAHQFCSICGVQPFCYGKNKEGQETVSLNVRTFDNIDLGTLERVPYNGKDR